jgi:hypothetical protein
MYLSYISIATRFKKKNFDVWISSEPGGDNTPSRSWSAYDKIDMLLAF